MVNMLSVFQFKKKADWHTHTDVAQNSNCKLHLIECSISERNAQPFCKAWRKLFKNNCNKDFSKMLHASCVENSDISA